MRPARRSRKASSPAWAAWAACPGWTCRWRMDPVDRPSGQVSGGFFLRAQRGRTSGGARRRRARPGLGSRPGRDVPALAAGAVLLFGIELLIDPRHRVLAVVGDMPYGLVERGAAFLAIPEEPVLLLGLALPFENEQEGVR